METFWLKIDGALWGDPHNTQGGFTDLDKLKLVAAEYGYTPLVTDPKIEPKTYILRVGGVMTGVAELVTMLPVKDISEIPRE